MKQEVIYGQYLVIMMDLLGQKEMYKVLESFTHSSEEAQPEFMDKLKEFIRMIEYFKKDVDSFLNGVNKSEFEFEWPDEAKAFVEGSKKQVCKVQRFSDGIMLYVPLGETSEASPVSSVFTALLCASSTMLVSLTKGNPIRVGVGLGGAAEIDEGELFGPAIGYAHDMESNRAKSPRIAIHENVIGYLQSHEELAPSEKLAHKFSYAVAKLCLSMIKQDGDGVYILDYLGQTVWDCSVKAVGDQLIKPAFEFACSQEALFKKQGNMTVANKYNYVKNYFLESGRV